jgi:hypothetical protein
MKKLIDKFLSWERLLKKEETRLWKYLRDKADTVFSIWIRNRDKKKDCITKDVPTCKHKIEHNCHWIERWRYSHRRDEKNCYWWCSSCNTFHEWEHKIYFTNFMIKTYWQERVDKQLRQRNKKKPSISELLKIIETYK